MRSLGPVVAGYRKPCIFWSEDCCCTVGNTTTALQTITRCTLGKCIWAMLIFIYT